MQQLPFEIIEIIYSYFHSPFDLKLNIQTFRYLNKHFYEFTENEIFWNHLIKYQRINNFHLHQWFYKYMFKRNATIYNEIIYNKIDASNNLKSCDLNDESEIKEINNEQLQDNNINLAPVVSEEEHNKETVNSDNNEEEDEKLNTAVLFPVIVKKWIDMFCKKDLKGENGECNKLLQFLLKISFSNNVIEYFSVNNMLSCFHYLFYKLLEPTLQYVNSSDKKIESFTKDNLFNLDILNFLQNLNKYEMDSSVQMSSNNWWDCIVISFWKDIELFYNIFPKNYLLFIIDNMSHLKMSNENIDVATFIVKELHKCGMNVHLFDFYNYGKYSNFDIEPFQEWIPPFTKRFLLQHFALWKENFNLLEFCLNPNKKETKLDILLRNLNTTTTTEFNLKECDKLSIFTMCNLTDNIGFTCLHYAIKKRDIKLIKLLLLQYQANPFQRSKYNFISPIELATLLNDKEVLSALNEIIGEEAINLHLKNKECDLFSDIYVKEEALEALEEEEENNESGEEEEEKSEKEESFVTKEKDEIINLEETKEKDLQKLKEDSISNHCPIRQYFTLESQENDDQYYAHSPIYPAYTEYTKEYSDDDNEEQIISLEWLNKIEKLNNNKENINQIIKGEEYLMNEVIDGQLREMKEFNDELKPFEEVKYGKYNQHDWSFNNLSVKIGKRKFNERIINNNKEEEENKKKLKLTNENVDNNNDYNNNYNNNYNNKVNEKDNNIEIPSSIKTRDSLIIPKNTMRQVVEHILQDYTCSIKPFTPMALNILQQGAENHLIKEMFLNANHFVNFFERDHIDLIDIKAVNEFNICEQGIVNKSHFDILGIKEYIYWKLQKVNQFNELVIKESDTNLDEIVKDIDKYTILLSKIIEELKNYNSYENKDNDDIEEDDDYSDKSEDECNLFLEHDIYEEEEENEEEEGYLTDDSNTSTVALDVSTRNNYEIDTIYFSSSEFIDNRIKKELFKSKKKDAFGRIYYIDRMDGDLIYYTKDKELAIDWLDMEYDSLYY
ncbi:hypothetical protein ABK040_015996 [Willaertia magna]